MGIGCSPWKQHAVFRLLRLKHRRLDKGLIVVAASIEQLSDVVDFSRVKDRTDICNSWPGHITWLIPARSKTPFWLTGQFSSLAVRVSDHPIVQSLCSAMGPLVSTSANPGGCAPALIQRRARSYFGRGVDYYVPGNIGNEHKPSEIKDALTGAVIRA